MDALLGTISALDAKGDYQGIHAQLQNTLGEVNELIFATGQLLIGGRYQAAYLVSKRLFYAGVRHPIAALAQAIGGVLFDEPGEEVLGRTHLSSLVDGFNPAQQVTFFKKVVEPVTYKLTDWHYANSKVEILLRLLEVLKAATPVLREVFDTNADVPPFDLAQHIRASRERARLIEFKSRPQGVPRDPRKGLVAMRERIFPRDPGSRPLDIGPRIAAAMNAYGWSTAFHGLKCVADVDDYGALTIACLRLKPDVLVIDDHLIQVPELRHPRAEMIAILRQALPSLKIVAFHPDPWELDVNTLREASAMLDAVWTGASSLPVWNYPDLQPKVIKMPLPHVGNYIAPEGPLPERITFVGSIKGFNYHRVYWLVTALASGLPIDWDISKHNDDGLSAIDSFAAYMQRVAKTGIQINFSMRPDLSRITTGRVFETLLSGALLVTEHSPDMDYHFVSGEHYLGFSSFSELCSIIQFIKEHPGEASAIRQCGYEFARQNYSDERIISRLDDFIFPGKAL
jgi:hypothetical protein